MKDSGIDWIGKIPDEWEINKIDSLYTLRNTKVSDKNYPPLSVTMKGIVPQLATAAKSDDGDNRKLVKKGDFVINSRSDRRGSSGISNYDGSVSLINTILTPRGKMNPDYYNWLFHTVQFEDEFYKWGHGIVDDLWTTRWQDMKNISVLVPPEEAQEKIAGFLDKKCSEIDSIIEESKKSIEEYKAWKQSVIFEAVTGKNLSCKKKNSGIEWLGEIPETWEVKRFKCIIDSLEKGNGITKDEVFSDGDTFCVRYGEIYSKYDTSFENCFSKTFKDKIPVKKYFSNGDLVFVGTGELVEEIGKCVAYLGNEQCLSGGDIIIAKHKQNAKFLSYAMNSHYAQAQKSCGKAKLKVVHISATEIGNVLLALPPLSEQESIAKFLDEKCAQIDSLISEKQSLIKDLAEYKKSLIFEAVTGKRRV
ncbi:restriction endonuclease subunit S [uncultured Treponema sp.]|uniref:restriction endonuclease subunit S n=1 Tax=uncultured Treponema sp. TaxID=162155 RepID=UPI0025F50AB6|nr:restriction endonuclease subunit S [uncultured Treponema sp.]